MSELLALITVNRFGMDAKFFKFIVEQDSRTRAWLPINKADARFGEVSETQYGLWIAACDDDALLPLGQMNQCQWNLGNRSADIGDIVNPAFGIEQVRAGDVSFAALQGK